MRASHFLRVAVIVAFGVISSARAYSAPSDQVKEANKKYEQAILRILSDGMGGEWNGIMKEFRDIDPQIRRQMSIDIREQEIEWRFQGEFPAANFNAAMLEYIVSSGDKAHESLLVVEGEQFDRLHRVGAAIRKFRDRRGDVEIDAIFAWKDDTGPMPRVRMAPIKSLVDPDVEPKRDDFLAQLNFLDAGLGGTINVQADATQLPKKRMDAQVYLIIRIGDG